MEKINYPNILKGNKVIEITELNGCQIVDNFGYKLNIDYSPREVSLDKVFMDLKNFQNRKKPYSEYSVQNIIDAVFNGNFDFRIFNPIIVWRNSQDTKLYILSGHSRYEAFRRLSSEYKDYSKVIEFQKKTGYDFGNILCMIMDDISFNDARMISLISNALATIESDTERAEIYRNFRQLGQNKKFIEEFGRRCEKNNRTRIEAYSYLNPNGSVIDLLESFEKNSDEINIIRRVAKWIGSFRARYLEISDLHEHELFDWLLNKGGYGTRNGQISTQQKFFDVVSKHLEEIKNKGQFSCDLKLNILKIQSLSNCMKNYYNLLDEIRLKKRDLLTQFHVLRRKLNKKIVTENRSKEVEELKSNLEIELGLIIQDLSKFEQLESFLFDIDNLIDEGNAEIIINNFKSQINKIEQDYYKLRAKKDFYVKFSKSEIKIDI